MKCLLISDCSLVAVGSSGILKGKQKVGITFNFDKLDFTKFSKMTMQCAGPQKQIHKSSRRSFEQKNYKGCFFFSKLKEI